MELSHFTSFTYPVNFLMISIILSGNGADRRDLHPSVEKAGASCAAKRQSWL